MNMSAPFRKSYISVVKAAVHAGGFSTPTCITKEDLIQQGMLIMLNTLKTFDAKKGKKVDSWIYLKVKYGIHDYLRQITKSRTYKGELAVINLYLETSLNESISCGEGGESTELIDLLRDDDEILEHAGEDVDMERLFASFDLNDRERNLILLRQEELFNTQIAPLLNISPSRVSQIHTRIKDKLKVA